jgi:tRNA-binding protein
VPSNTHYRFVVTDSPTLEDFEALAFRVGTVVRAELNDGARDAAYKLWIDVGVEIPVQSSAKVADLYEAEELIGRQVIVVTGFAPMRVGGFRSDVLVVGAVTNNGIVLVKPDEPVPPGTAVA